MITLRTLLLRAGGAFALHAALQSVATTPIQAQTTIHLAPGTGELGGSADFRSRQTSLATAALRDQEFRWWIQIPVAGSVLSPSLLSFRAAIRPTWQRRLQAGVPDLRSRQLDYSGAVDLLARSPISFSVAAGRSSGVTSGGFGGDRSFRRGTLSATAGWRFQPLPLQATAWRTDTRDDWRSGPDGAPIRTGYRAKGFRVSAANTKTALILTRTLNDDLFGTADYAAWAASASHTGRWGKGSRLITRWELERQAGIPSFQRRLWSEQLHLQHTNSVATDLHFQRSWNRLGTTGSRATTVSGAIATRLQPWLSTGISSTYSTAASGSARERTTLLTPRVGLDLRVGSVVLHAGMSTGWERRRASGETQVLTVVDESHTVAGARAFSLGREQVDPATIVVRTRDQGFELLQDVDYVVVLLGPIVRLEFPVGSRVEDGTVVLVSYRYRVEGPLGSDAWRWDYEVSLLRNGLSLRHQRSLRRDARDDPLPLEGGSPEYDDRQTRAAYRRDTRVGGFDLTLSLRSLTRRERTAEREASAGYHLPPLFDGRGSLGAGATLSDATADAVHARTLSTFLTARLLVSRTLSLDARGQYLRWTRTDSPSQRFLAGSADLSFQPGMITARLHAEYTQQDATFRHRTNRIAVYLLRRF